MAPTMKWDHEADAKLFGLFLNIFDMKVSGDMLKKLNAAMGLDPKSQAISHRIGATRKRAAGLVNGTPVKAAPITPRGPSLGHCAGSTPGKRGAAKGKALKDESDSDGDDGVGSPTPVVKRESLRQGRKREYREPETEDEEGGEPERKKVKREGEEGGGERSFFDGDAGVSDTEVDTEPDEV
ncbi:hypothetical protein UCRNP2_6559 [Neofusicoccum parvum UCRNP2]|uniref:Uncharacterized protein n=1 Tax=Botryosphaeria parva (strain UCR-NP2) TaxID=1287680 RepID=R1EGQ3_BOTPV|nr:hypothetical protein UCRNP2_6559 [Neofusicoccum parvum UCRNP2]